MVKSKMVKRAEVVDLWVSEMRDECKRGAEAFLDYHCWVWNYFQPLNASEFKDCMLSYVVNRLKNYCIYKIVLERFGGSFVVKVGKKKVEVNKQNVYFSLREVLNIHNGGVFWVIANAYVDEFLSNFDVEGFLRKLNREKEEC